LDDAIAMVEELLRGTTVADVLAEPGSVTPLCEGTKVFSINTSDTARRPAAKPRDTDQGT
jgi:hypothetical protein